MPRRDPLAAVRMELDDRAEKWRTKRDGLARIVHDLIALEMQDQRKLDLDDQDVPQAAEILEGEPNVILVEYENETFAITIGPA